MTIDLLRGEQLVPICDYRGKTLEERVALLESRLDALLYKQYDHRDLRFDSEPYIATRTEHNEHCWIGDIVDDAANPASAR